MNIEDVVKKSKSYREVCLLLDKSPIGGQYRKVRQEIIDKKLDISHFNPFSRNHPRPKIPLDKILVKGSTYPTAHLRKRLIKEGIKAEVCEECGLGPSWNEKPLTLQLDHIDGDSTNHSIGNLKVLCPNCHTQTDTYCGKNVGKHK